MSNKVINFADHFNRRAPQSPALPATLDDMREPLQDIQTSPVEFEPEEIKKLLDLHRQATPTGYIRDYAMPMCADARPLFSFKTRAEDPDYMSMEKARTEDGTNIYIIRRLGQTPVIENNFDDASKIISDEIGRLKMQKRLQVVDDNFTPQNPEQS